MKSNKVENQTLDEKDAVKAGDDYPNCEGEPCANMAEETNEETDTVAENEAPAEEEAPKEEKSGCGGMIGFATILALIPAAIVIKKKRD